MPKAPATSSPSSPPHGFHCLEPEAYLRDIIRVLPHWPRERYLELAPKYWAQTRARLIPAELGELTVPPLLTAAAEQQTATR